MILGDSTTTICESTASYDCESLPTSTAVTLNAPLLSDVYYTVFDELQKMIVDEFTVPMTNCILTQAMSYTMAVSPVPI